MANNSKYKPSGLVVVEMVSCVVGLALLFTPWLAMKGINFDDEPFTLLSASVMKVASDADGPGIYFIVASLVACFVLKFFMRATWMSVIAAFFYGTQIYGHLAAITELKQRAHTPLSLENMTGMHAEPTVWYFLAIIVEVILISSVFVGFANWVLKRGKSSKLKETTEGAMSIVTETPATSAGSDVQPNSFDRVVTVDVGTSTIRPWHYILGIGVVVAALTAIILPGLLKKKDVDIQLLEAKPVVWEKFVKLDDASKLYSQPDVKTLLPNIGSGISPVLDETDNFYQIYYSVGSDPVWVRKNQCREVNSVPITKENVREVLLSQQGVYHASRYFSEGNLKGLYFMTFSSGEEEYMRVVLLDEKGWMIEPWGTKWQTVAVEVKGLALSESEMQLFLEYGPDYHQSNDNGLSCLNLSEITAQQAVDIWVKARPFDPNQVNVCYWFPSENMLANFLIDLNVYGENISHAGTKAVEVPTAVTAYSVLDKGDGVFELMAEVNGSLVSTGLDYSGNAGVGVVSTADFDGDGRQDCIVSWHTGGNCSECQGCDLVFYSEEDDGFHQISNIPTADIEQWHDMPTLVEHRGISMTRYALREGTLTVVEEKTADVGSVVWTRTRENLFPVADELSDDREEWFDVDGDGTIDKIVFGHDNSHASDFGRTMYIKSIECSGGIMLSDDYFGLQSGECFQFLDHLTDGMCDLLIDDNLFRWNGSEYSK